jgi:hypothetical protein
MNTHGLPVELGAEDLQRVQRILADLREASDGSGTLSVFLPVPKQVIVLLVYGGEIVSWCLMPAKDQPRAHTLTSHLRGVLGRELEIVCEEVKSLADAAIRRASQIA